MHATIRHMQEGKAACKKTKAALFLKKAALIKKKEQERERKKTCREGLKARKTVTDHLRIYGDREAHFFEV